MIGKCLRSSANRRLLASARGGGHWHRPDVPMNVFWTPERHYSIYDINTWYYDASMPEYMIHNHELLCFAGENVEQMAKTQWKMLSKFGLVLASGALIYVLLVGRGLDMQYAPADDNTLRMLEDMKKEKIAFKPDFMGTGYTADQAEFVVDYAAATENNAAFWNGEARKTVQTVVNESKTWWSAAAKNAENEARKRLLAGTAAAAHK